MTDEIIKNIKIENDTITKRASIINEGPNSINLKTTMVPFNDGAENQLSISKNNEEIISMIIGPKEEVDITIKKNTNKTTEVKE